MADKSERDQPLRGMRVLVAEDEYFIAVALEEALRDAGADIVHASTLPAALERAKDQPLSLAVLDVRLGRHSTEAVADLLAARAVPFIFYSGNSLPAPVRDKHPNVRVLLKPVRQEEFVETVVAVTRH